MKKRFLSITLVLASSILMGCAFTPQQVTFNPKLDTITNSNQGNNVSVSVQVSDERVSKSLGRRGSGYGPAAEISSTENLADIVNDQLVSGLRKKGFNAVSAKNDAGTNAKLLIEIRLLEYSTSMGFWTGGVHIKGAVKALAQKNNKAFDQIYRVEKEERVVVVPTAETNSEWLNQTLTELLTQVLQDANLVNFLAQN